MSDYEQQPTTLHTTPFGFTSQIRSDQIEPGGGGGPAQFKHSKVQQSVSASAFPFAHVTIHARWFLRGVLSCKNKTRPVFS